MQALEPVSTSAFQLVGPARSRSLGGGASQALDDAVKRSAGTGAFYSVAAGNDDEDACNSSPTRAGTSNGVMTTAATDDRTDNEAAFSNFGPCVAIWAPGVNILSTRDGGGMTMLSGTSMAAPRVGGTGALFLPRNAGASAAATEPSLKSSSVATGTNSEDGRAIRLVYAGGY